MTREETINVLKTLQDMYRVNTYVVKSIDMAIEALQAEPTKAVPPSLADVYKWERDIALSQLEEYGIGFAEKKRDDLVEVVRCGSCKNLSSDGRCEEFADDCIRPSATDFCSHGERREP